jgi:hypothetical protein
MPRLNSSSGYFRSFQYATLPCALTDDVFGQLVYRNRRSINHHDSASKKWIATRTIQAVTARSNQESLCICETTTKEAETAMNDDPAFDGYGLYLVKVDTRHPKSPAAVLAKFASEEAAAIMAQFLRFKGGLEPA